MYGICLLLGPSLWKLLVPFLELTDEASSETAELLCDSAWRCLLFWSSSELLS